MKKEEFDLVEIINKYKEGTFVNGKTKWSILCKNLFKNILLEFIKFKKIDNINFTAKKTNVLLKASSEEMI